MSDKHNFDDAGVRARLAELLRQPTATDDHFVQTDAVDEFVSYLEDALSDERLTVLDEHLRGCSRCLERLARLLDGTEDWLNPHSRQTQALLDRVKSIELRAIRGLAPEADSDYAGISATMVLHALQVTSRARAVAKKGRQSTITYEMQEAPNGEMVLSIRTSDPSWIVGPIRCEFGASGGPERLAAVWVMLHESPAEPGVLVGSVRLGGNRHAFASREASLSTPHVDLSDAKAKAELIAAVEAAASDVDAEALRDWLTDQESGE